MRIVLFLVVLLAAPGSDLSTLLAQGRYAEAVRSAPDAATLLAATSALKGESAVAAVVHEVVLLHGPLKDRAKAASWLDELSNQRGGDPAALTGEGYLRLVSGDLEGATKALEHSTQIRADGLALAYLGEVYRRRGMETKARTTLTRAMEAKGAPKDFVQKSALALAARLRGKRDTSYGDLLRATGQALEGAMWLAEDAGYAHDPQRAKALGAKALALFNLSLDDQSPAQAYYEAAKLASGDLRFRYLREAVARGGDPRTPQVHSCPGALLDLARECAARNRPIAARDLARRRLALGDCPAAWEVLESLPPELVVQPR